MEKRNFKVRNYMVLIAICLMGMLFQFRQEVQASTEYVKFIDGYSDNRQAISELTINNIVDWYSIKLPYGWNYTDRNLTIEVSDEKVAYLEYEKNEVDGFYVCGNYEIPYKSYKPVTITAIKKDPATGNKKIAKLKVYRCDVFCTDEEKTVYEGTSFKMGYKTVSDKNKKYRMPLQFDSSDTSVAIVSKKGIVTAKKAGKAGIVVRNEGGNAVMELTVKPLPSIDRKNITLNTGENVKLKIEKMPKGTTVTWKSSNKKVASVTNGTVKANAYGKAEIIASYKLDGKNRQSKCTVTVKKPQLSKTSITLPVRMSASLKVNGLSGKAKWATSNPKVATVKNGKVTATGTGKCKITAKVNGQTLACNVQVRANEKKWKVVKRAGYYRSAYDCYEASKIKYNANGSMTVEGYFVNTHLYSIESFDYMYIEIKDGNGRAIASYKAPKFKFSQNSYTVKKLTLTIPKSRVKKVVNLAKEDVDLYYDYVYNYRW